MNRYIIWFQMFGRIQYEYIYIQLNSHTEVLAHLCLQAKADTIFLTQCHRPRRTR